MLTVAARACVPLFVVSVAVATTALVTRPRTVPVVTMAPPAPMIVPPRIAPVEPPPVASPIGTTCAVASEIGEPLPYLSTTSTWIEGVATSDDGCAIAAWSGTRLALSWDGGATFAAFRTDAPIRGVAVTQTRAALIAGRALGFVPAGSREIAWHTPVDAVTHDTWNVVTRGAATLVQGDGWMGISDDNGWTWRTLATPPAVANPNGPTRVDDITPEGTLHASASEILGDPGMDGLHVAPHAFTAKLADMKWSAATTHHAGWTYQFETDEFWGCGGTSKLVATKNGKARVLASELNGAEMSYGLAISSHAGFAQMHGDLFRLDKGRALPTEHHANDDHATAATLVALDGTGAPLLTLGSALVRWTPDGGFRLLTTL